MKICEYCKNFSRVAGDEGVCRYLKSKLTLMYNMKRMGSESGIDILVNSNFSCQGFEEKEVEQLKKPVKT